MELKPCPFCGGEVSIREAIIEGTDEHSFAVICNRCHLGVFKARISLRDEWNGYRSPKEAATDWNRRASDERTD